MTRWEECLYAFPDDDGATLAATIEAMPARLEWDFTCLPFGGWRLRVDDPSAAVFLRLAVADIGIADDNHPYLRPGELYVPDAARHECQRELATRCVSNAEWSEIVWVEFRTSGARAAFDGLIQLSRPCYEEAAGQRDAITQAPDPPRS